MLRTLLTSLSTILLLMSQAPAQQSNATVLATASIEGVVFHLGTTNPIAGADVELSRVEGTPRAPMDPVVANLFVQALQGVGTNDATPPPLLAPEVKYVKTGADGRFVFRDLKEGKYRLVSVKVGGTYNPAEYGQHDPRQRGLNFLLLEGQAMTGVQLGMVPTSAISGRVLDADGEPMGHVSVMALDPQTLDRRRVYNIMQASYTNEQGEYRLFWLPPGRYIVAAKVEDLQKRAIPSDQIPPGRRGPYLRAEVPVVTRHTLPSGDVVEEAFAVVYNGGVLDPAQAQPIEVRPGATSTGVDIPMAAGRLRSHHIRGLVLDASGKPARGASVTAFPRQFSADVLMLRGSTDNEGVFDLGGAVPGSYSIYASATTQANIPPQPVSVPGSNRPAATPELGHLNVDMGNSDLENLRITTTAGWTLPARVTIEGHTVGNDPDMARFRIVLTRDPDVVGTPAGLMPLPPLPPGTPANTRLAHGQPDGSGNATLLVAPGDYRVSMTVFTATYYMKSIRMGGIDVWNNGMSLASPPENPLELVIGTDAGEITGVLRNDRMEPVTNAVVALVPQSTLLRFRNATTDGDGKFRFPTVPPGTYKIFAWEYADPQQWQDAEFLRPYESSGKPIEMKPGGKVDMPLTVLPRR
jgi:hypothetical protein